jgi:RNA polymerase sigma-70 factor (ECF subfamily)
MTSRVLEIVTPNGPLPEEWDWIAMRELCVRVAAGILWSREVAEDAAQEAVVRALNDGRSRSDLDDPDAWLATIARNEALRVWKSEERIRVRRTGDEVLHAVAVPDRDLERLEGRLQLEAMSLGLAPYDRLLIRLRYVDDLTQLEIANRLGILEGNAKVRLHRAREKIKRELRDRG